jgi:hypothetical protein
MRQRKPRAGWEGDPRAAQRQPGVWMSGRILDLADPVELPELDRVQPHKLDRHRPKERAEGVRQPWGQVIVQDYLDGRRVYPEPPHLTRRVNRLGRLVRRMSATTWLFFLLALAQALASATDILSSSVRSSPALAGLVLHSIYVCTLAALPAGVLIWRSDAWRSARLVLGGVVLWTTAPSLAGLAWRLARLSAVDDRVVIGLGLIGGGAAALACLGPLVMAFGLNRIRRTRADWLWPATWQGGLLMIMPVTYSSGRLLLVANGEAATPLTEDAGARLAASLAGATQPLELLGLAMLACLCLSAMLAEEPQKRMWQCAAAGAALLLGVGVHEFFTGAMVGIPMPLDPGAWDLAVVVAAAGLVAGNGLLLLAFTSTVWSAARDAEGPGRGAPEEVFTWGPYGWGAIEPLAMDEIVAVAAGVDHALAVDGCGRVGAWGDNTMGQIDIPEDLGDVIAVAAGDGFSLALQAAGTVVAWGANDRGQTDVPAGLSGVTAIAAGHGFGLALRSDGTVVAWGDPAGDATSVPDDLIGVAAISAGACHALALRSDGSVAGWGDGSCGQSQVPLRLRRAKAISAGGDFSLALLADGTVVAWGDNSYGQLDVPETLANVATISAGAFHAVALLANGDVIGWGGGRMAGEADHPWRLVDFKAIAAGDGFSLAIRVA